MQTELVGHDDRIQASQERARQLDETNAQHNVGISARNERDGTSIPLRPSVPTPDGVVFGFNASAVIDELADESEEFDPFSFTFVMARIKVLSEQTAAPLDLASWYSVGYRGLSMNAVHPTATVFARYIQNDTTVWRVNPMSAAATGPELLRGMTFLVLLAAEKAMEFLGLDESWFGGHVAAIDAAITAADAGPTTTS